MIWAVKLLYLRMLKVNIYMLLSAFLFLRAVEHNEASDDEVFKYHIILWIVAVFAILIKLSAVTPVFFKS